tara:strand:+ start:3028 stop:3549 length:522 start_codon:yes stop_codon:yes gene_type:complete
MDVEEFKICIEYILQRRFNENETTPNNLTINAVRNYNLMRAQSAKNIAQLLNNNVLLNNIRHSVGVEQLNNSPPNTKCILSNEILKPEVGKTLILNKANNTNIPYCIHQRYLKHINNYFCIMHFDKEVIKEYTGFMCQINDVANLNNIGSFISYNNSSNIKRLLIKFNNICET